jgi:hypothetical protein
MAEPVEQSIAEMSTHSAFHSVPTMPGQARNAGGPNEQRSDRPEISLAQMTLECMDAERLARCLHRLRAAREAAGVVRW